MRAVSGYIRYEELEARYLYRHGVDKENGVGAKRYRSAMCCVGGGVDRQLKTLM